MLGTVAKKIFGSRNDRLVKKYSKTVKKINELEESITTLNDQQLKEKTTEFKTRLEAGETLDDILPEAFAVVREASHRVLAMRHYDVQLIGGMVLNDGNIAEMKTGEGKTLVATAAVYLNALSGKGVHVITVNDYLAQRDAAQMSQLYGFLGLTTGVIVNGLNQLERQEAYGADITYGTNNEFGFDYLRDNMAFRSEDRVQRGLNFAVVDEVDSILIDEARTPLIISGQSETSSEMYQVINAIIPKLERQEVEEKVEEEVPEEDRGDYTLDEKSKQVFLTEQGQEKSEKMLQELGLIPEYQSLFDSASVMVLHHLNAALRAHTLFQLNVDYIIQNGEIIIVDEFTGRTMPGRRWSEGLHQAIEAKEGVEIQPESQTMASITFQNYFRIYEKLSGMTGTADTEAFELQDIYGLEVVVIPTHRPMIRDDANDFVFLTEDEKYEAIVKDIKVAIDKQRPVLVGTASIESSEKLSGLLKQAKIKHEVLNAKQHEREANIIENAGRAGQITIATNMAGRGTDIVLGGNMDAEIAELEKKTGSELTVEQKNKVKTVWQDRHDAVVNAGGLHIIGTERHESRRIDNQLRGRSGRQGDPGSSRFFLSLEDNLMRIFASDRVKAIMQRLGMERGQAIEAGLVSKSIENAQRKVEAHNYDIRKNLLEYDDVANDQRKVIYEQRNELLEADDVSDTIESIREDVIANLMARFVPPGSIDEQWDIPGLEKALVDEFGLELPVQKWLDEDDSLYEEPLREKVEQSLIDVMAVKEGLISEENMRRLEREVMLHVLDTQWKEHLAAMDYLRQSVGLRGYAQKNPKQEYKREAFELFEDLLDKVKHEAIAFLAKVEVTHNEPGPTDLLDTPSKPMEYKHAEAHSALDEDDGDKIDGAETEQQQYRRPSKKVGRNDPCPCGSGKKYKHCHGKLD
jgi:preprotein translocase subunit SecA